MHVASFSLSNKGEGILRLCNAILCKRWCARRGHLGASLGQSVINIGNEDTSSQVLEHRHLPGIFSTTYLVPASPWPAKSRNWKRTEVSIANSVIAGCWHRYAVEHCSYCRGNINKYWQDFVSVLNSTISGTPLFADNVDFSNIVSYGSVP